MADAEWRATNELHLVALEFEVAGQTTLLELAAKQLPMTSEVSDLKE